jgi:hypothetical protein
LKWTQTYSFERKTTGNHSQAGFRRLMLYPAFAIELDNIGVVQEAVKDSVG